MAQRTRPQAESLYGMPQPLQSNLVPPVIAKRDPTSADTGYPLGQIWDNKTGNKLWGLTSVSAGSANWAELGGGTDTYPVTPYVVGPLGQAGYQTIQSAVNAANAAGGGIVVVQPGSYTENLTLYSHCHILGLTLADAGGGVNIIGTHTPPLSGGFAFNNVFLSGTSSIFNSNAAGSSHLIIANAEIIVTSGYTFNLPNWTGKFECFDINGRGSGTDGFVNNTGGAEVAFFEGGFGAGTANSMIVSGAVSIFNCAVGCPMNCVTGANVFLELNVHLGHITLSNNSTGEITLCEIDAPITMSSSQSILITTSVINTSTNPAIGGAGAGTLTLGDINFIDNSTIAGTLTVAWGSTHDGVNTLTSTGPTISALNIATGGINVPVTTNAAGSSPQTVNARFGQAIFTDTIANGAYGTLTITDSVVTGASKILVTASCTTVNSAIIAAEVTPGSGSFAVRLFNAGASSTAANILITFWVLS